jgi:hypothetical protein
MRHQKNNIFLVCLFGFAVKAFFWHWNYMYKARCQWLTPAILAIQEAKIRRIMVWRQTQQIVHKTLSWKTHHSKELVEWLKV